MFTTIVYCFKLVISRRILKLKKYLSIILDAFAEVLSNANEVKTGIDFLKVDNRIHSWFLLVKCSRILLEGITFME